LARLFEALQGETPHAIADEVIEGTDRQRPNRAWRCVATVTAPTPTADSFLQSDYSQRLQYFGVHVVVGSLPAPLHFLCLQASDHESLMHVIALSCWHVKKSPYPFNERGQTLLVPRCGREASQGCSSSQGLAERGRLSCYGLVAGLAIIASIALPQSRLNWKPRLVRSTLLR
jgi:hypothetical protein